MSTTNNSVNSQNPINETPVTYIVSPNTTLRELITILRARPETQQAAQEEQESIKTVQKLNHMREILKLEGFEVDEPVPEELIRANRRPGAVQLRTTVQCLGKMNVGAGSLEVYANGYAVYDNGDRKTVLWVPDCKQVVYTFGELSENEKTVLTQRAVLSEDVLGILPWFNALVIVGENQIERNLEHPKSNGTRSDTDNPEEEGKAELSWIGAARFEGPEEAYLRKEAEEERRAQLSEKQREVYELYYGEGLSLREISKMLNVSFQVVDERLKWALKHLKKTAE